MGKDCGQGNEQLGAKAQTVCYVTKGEVGGPKIPPDLPACVSLSKCPESGQKKGYLSKETALEDSALCQATTF